MPFNFFFYHSKHPELEPTILKAEAGALFRRAKCLGYQPASSRAWCFPHANVLLECRAAQIEPENIYVQIEPGQSGPCYNYLCFNFLSWAMALQPTISPGFLIKGLAAPTISPSTGIYTASVCMFTCKQTPLAALSKPFFISFYHAICMSNPNALNTNDPFALGMVRRIQSNMFTLVLHYWPCSKQICHRLACNPVGWKTKPCVTTDEIICGHIPMPMSSVRHISTTWWVQSRHDSIVNKPPTYIIMTIHVGELYYFWCC